MTREVHSVPGDLTLEELIHEHILTYDHSSYPVFEGDQLVGTLTLKSVGAVPREKRAAVTAREVASPLSQDQTISPEADLWTALTKMAASGDGPLLVISRVSLVGIISRSDIMRSMRTRMELGIP
jgi:CBS domain-containing protein